MRQRGSVTGTLLLLLIVAATAAGAYVWWERSARTRSTDNAYVNADMVQVSSLVAGRVVAVHVQENQFVKKGAPLFEVDPKPLRVAVDRARAQVDIARQGTQQDMADVRAGEAEVNRYGTDLANAELQQKRAESLVAKGFMSQQAVDDAAAKVSVSRAALEQARARLQRARAALISPNGQTPAVAAALANLAQAQLELGYSKVFAPHDGWVVNKRLNEGSSVNPGQPLFGIIKDGTFWIDANFKETELPGLRPGLAADVVVDMYPGHTFRGRIESLSGGTGSAFSLLPPQNATGNWVKVTQRVPVKVRLESLDREFPLRVGATATVTVHVK